MASAPVSRDPGQRHAAGQETDEEHDGAHREQQSQQSPLPAVQQRERQEHQQAQEQVRREDLRERQDAVALGQQDTHERQTQDSEAGHDAHHGAGAADHARQAMRRGSPMLPRISASNPTHDRDTARRILPCMTDEHPAGGNVATVEGIAIDPDAHPGGDPQVPAPTSRLSGLALGIDVGGTGVKAALVDLATAQLAGARFRERTPQPSTPEAVAQTIASVVAKVLEGQDVPDTLPVGCGLPGIVKDGRLASAANIDQRWIGWPATDNISAAIGRQVLIINDADAAGHGGAGVRRGRWPHGHGAAADHRHRHRQRPVHRRPPGAQHRVRPPRVPRPGRRDARQRRRA